MSNNLKKDEIINIEEEKNLEYKFGNFIVGWDLQREKYTQNKKEYYAYFIEGEARGKMWKAYITVDNVGSYELIEQLFNYNNAKFAFLPYELLDQKGRITNKGNTYHVVSYDESIDNFDSVKVKPRNSTDRAVIDMLYKRLAF